MTMPHLQNCDHSDTGWCLDCVKKLHDEWELKLDIQKSCRFQHNAEELKAIGELLAFLEAWPESTNHADLGIEGKIEVWWTDSLMGVIEGDCESGWDYHPLAFGEKGTQERHGKNI